ncbi:MAG: hypothetical protein IJ024_06735 [Lachnospiraceae bacterium]|nr:hypothetical protein [Lachnospiraceae bacterium]
MEENTVTKEETFEYTYSAKRQEEIEAIKNKYLPPKEDKMEQLRKLDASVTLHATMWSISIGVIGLLIFGGGMSCTLVGAKNLFVPGIVIGLIGLAVMGLALPVYRVMEKKQREKIAPEILALAEELSQ